MKEGEPSNDMFVVQIKLKQTNPEKPDDVHIVNVTVGYDENDHRSRAGANAILQMAEDNNIPDVKLAE